MTAPIFIDQQSPFSGANITIEPGGLSGLGALVASDGTPGEATIGVWKTGVSLPRRLLYDAFPVGVAAAGFGLLSFLLGNKKTGMTVLALGAAAGAGSFVYRKSVQDELGLLE